VGVAEDHAAPPSTVREQLHLTSGGLATSSTTVRRWIDTFEAKYPQFVALVGEEVARVWRLYLVGGALSFEEGRMGVDQILATRRGRPIT